MKKSKLIKIIKESIKELQIQEKLSLNEVEVERVKGVNNINNYCLGCVPDCCNMYDYGGNLLTGVWADLACGGCAGMPTGTIIGPDGQPVNLDNLVAGGSLNKGDFLPPQTSTNRPPMKMKPKRRMNEDLLTETITCTYSNINACTTYVDNCLDGGGYIQTNPANNPPIVITCINEAPTDSSGGLIFRSKEDFASYAQNAPNGGNVKLPMGKSKRLKSKLRERFQKLAAISEQGAGPRPSGPPTKAEFQKLLTRKLKGEGYNDDEISKLHPLIWIVITATFVKYLDNMIDDE